MPVRIVGIVITVLLIACSCTQSGMYYKTVTKWFSVPFTNVAVSADGRYLTVANGDYMQVYSKELQLVGEFKYNTNHGLNPTYLEAGYNQAGSSGYDVYTAIPDYTGFNFDTEFPMVYTNPAAINLTKYNETGEAQWTTKLGPDYADGITQFIVAPDGTHYLADTTGVEAISATGDRLWEEPYPADVIRLCDDGTLIACGDDQISLINPDGSLLNSRTVTGLIGVTGDHAITHILNEDGSPIILSSRKSLLAIDDELNLAWLHTPPDDTSRTSYRYNTPVLRDGVLYYIQFGGPTALLSSYHTDTYTLIALNASTGEKLYEAALADDTEVSILAVRENGNCVVTPTPNTFFSSLAEYNNLGLLESHTNLEMTGLKYNNDPNYYTIVGTHVNGASILGTATDGTIYYQTLTQTGPEHADYVLVAIDLDGDIIGTAVTNKGEWRTVKESY